MMARTPLASPVFVGKSPAGIEYWARFEGDEARLRASLDRQAAKVAAKPVRVAWTPAQRDRVLEGLSKESLDKFTAGGLTFRSTFVEGPQSQLSDLASFLDPHEAADLAGAGYAETPEQVAFAQCQAFASTLMLQRKLEGRPITIQVARKAASKSFY